VKSVGGVQDSLMDNVYNSALADILNTNFSVINVPQFVKNVLKMQMNVRAVNKVYCLRKGTILVLKHAPQVLSKTTLEFVNNAMINVIHV
jgi:hypothetical protein